MFQLHLFISIYISIWRTLTSDNVVKLLVWPFKQLSTCKKDYWSDYTTPLDPNTNDYTWETPETTPHLANTFLSVQHGGTVMLCEWISLAGTGEQSQTQRDPRRNPAAERAQPQTGRARVAEAPGQGKAGVASSMSVLEWPSHSLNLNCWLKAAISARKNLLIYNSCRGKEKT